MRYLYHQTTEANAIPPPSLARNIAPTICTIARASFAWPSKSARNQRFDLKLPPLESMYAVQSALTQLAEALAADMIDPKRAQAMLTVLRLASLNLRHPEKWQTTLYHADQPGPAVDLVAEFGLPAGLDIDTPPEVAFPLSQSGSWGHVNCPMLAIAGSQPPTTGNPVLMISNSDPDYPVTADYVELDDIRRTQGEDAVLARSTQMLRSQSRRAFHSEHKRFAAIAAQINLHRAAEKLAARKLAEKQATDNLSVRKPPTSAPVANGETLATKEATTARHIEPAIR